MAEDAEASKAAPAADEETAASLRKHRKLSLLQGKISKVSRAARMAGGSLHGGDANAARRKTSTSFVAKFKDETSAKELVIPWAHGKDLEQLKQMVMKEFDHAEVSGSETGSHTAPPHVPPAAPPHPSAHATTSQVNLLDAETGSLVDDEASLRLVCGMGSNPRLQTPGRPRSATHTREPRLAQMAEDWKEREGARKHDHLAAWVLQLSTLLAEQETLERGLHGLWELACRPSNHAEISVAVVDEMVGA